MAPASPGSNSTLTVGRPDGRETGDGAPKGLEFKLLGPLEVYVDRSPLQVRGMRQRAVLARLLLAQGRVVSVDTLIAEVWDGRPPNTARTQVSICVAALRKAFRAAGRAEEVIRTVAPGYQLCLSRGHVDSVEFTREVERGQGLARQGRALEAAQVLKQALSLWRGPALGGVSAQFAELEAERLSEQRLLATEQLLTLRLNLGEHRTLIGELSALVRAHPLRERLRATLMLAQYRAGRRAEALLTFREGRDLSIDELGLEPGVELQAMHDSILKNASLAPAHDAEVAAEAEGVRIPSQLPSIAGEFVGRETELRMLDALLSTGAEQHSAAACFISGSPGSGKTALAVHWGRTVARHFPDGQLFSDLGQITSDGPEETALLVLQRFLRALGTPAADIPRDLEECSALYRSVLAGRRVLIVMDNATSFKEVEPLFPGGGGCCVLVTGLDRFMDSRGAAGIRLGPVSRAEAIEMLGTIVGQRRIAEEQPDAVDRLVELCDRLPLAIRAAGARLESKPHWFVEDLVARLADYRRRLDVLSHGEHSLRACFDRAVCHLPLSAAAAYRALSVTGSREFDAQTAAELLHMALPNTEDLLERLVDLNLLEARRRLRRDCLRYRYGSLFHLHAAEQLATESSLEQSTLRLTRWRRHGRSTADSISMTCS